MDNNQIILNEIIAMDNKFSDELKSVPFDKGLPIIRKELWKIADNHNTTGAEVFRMYMEYMGNKNKQNS